MMATHYARSSAAMMIMAITCMSASALGASNMADYYPLAEGSAWEYRVIKESVLAHGGQRRVTPKPGNVTERVVGKSNLRTKDHSVVVLRRRVEERNTTMPSPVVAEMDHHLSSDASGVLLHALVPARQEPGTPVNVQTVLNDPPAEGTVIQQAGTLELRTKVVSQTREAVKVGKVSYKDCIRVEHKGTVAGQLGRAPVNGSVEETSWYAKGIGVVKVVRIMRLDLRGPKGEKATAEDTMTKLLERHSQGRSQ